MQKISQILLHKPSYSQFSPKFRYHGNGGQSGKNAIGSIRWRIAENPPIRAKISQKFLTQVELKPTLSQISLPWQRRLVGEKFGWQHSMAHPRKSHYRRKNLADISYTDRFVVNFVPKFVAMATGVARREI